MVDSIGMNTIVLSGPAHNRLLATRLVAQAGGLVETGGNAEHGHGFTAEDGESFLTAQGADLDSIVRSVEPLGWGLRLHWNTGAESKWQKVGPSVAVADPMAEMAKLRSQLKAAGIEGF